jgi:hypothetical protein
LWQSSTANCRNPPESPGIAGIRAIAAARAGGAKRLQTGRFARPQRCILMLLHTREVAGSKPAAPIRIPTYDRNCENLVGPFSASSGKRMSCQTTASSIRLRFMHCAYTPKGQRRTPRYARR